MAGHAIASRRPHKYLTVKGRNKSRIQPAIVRMDEGKFGRLCQESGGDSSASGQEARANNAASTSGDDLGAGGVVVRAGARRSGLDDRSAVDGVAAGGVVDGLGLRGVDGDGLVDNGRNASGNGLNRGLVVLGGGSNSAGLAGAVDGVARASRGLGRGGRALHGRRRVDGVARSGAGGRNGRLARRDGGAVNGVTRSGAGSRNSRLAGRHRGAVDRVLVGLGRGSGDGALGRRDRRRDVLNAGHGASGQDSNGGGETHLDGGFGGLVVWLEKSVIKR
jgi:hypothetical protein